MRPVTYNNLKHSTGSVCYFFHLTMLQKFLKFFVSLSLVLQLIFNGFLVGL